MSYPKVYLGPMTKKTVDATIELSKDYPVGFIPSRRQVDYNGGYVNGWTTGEFRNYVPNEILIQRDHGGPGQGTVPDDGLESLKHDVVYCDLIHIDPWKAFPFFADGMKYTCELMRWCDSYAKHMHYEVGTEEAIRYFDKAFYESMFHWLKAHLPGELYQMIYYVVVQSGTGLDLPNQRNTGVFDEDRLAFQLKLAQYRGVMTKEHNGDYLSADDIRKRFDMGLDAINIAPEIGQYETEALVAWMKEQDRELLDCFYVDCLESRRWEKWVGPDFKPAENRDQLILTAGHYIISQFGDKYDLPVYDIVKEKIKNRLESIYA